MCQKREIRSGIRFGEHRRIQPAFFKITFLLFALTITYIAPISAVLAQENNEPADKAFEEPEAGQVEPVAPNDAQIQVEADNLGVPPVSPNRKRSNGLRKTLLKQEPVEDAEAVNAGPAAPRGNVQAEENAAPADVTTKSPPKPKKLMIPTDPVGLFLAGGHLMPVILLASIISLWFGLERLFVLRRGRVIPRAFVNRFLQHLEEGKLTAETALRLCEENRSPMAEIFAHGVRKWGKTSVEVEQAIIDGGERQVARLRTNLRVINGMANIAPMLGLLGTVFGMILSFNELAQGIDTNRSERLANGIGHALITTAAGLAVAILSIVMYMFLSGKIDRLVMEMDELSQKVVNLISGEALASRPRISTSKPVASVAPASPVINSPAGKPRPVGT